MESPTTNQRIRQVPKPDKEVEFEEWKAKIVFLFPELAFPAETAISVICQLLINDISNPFALVLVDVPASGKTLTINFFDRIPELTYASDKFTPASFLSHAANVK